MRALGSLRASGTPFARSLQDTSLRNRTRCYGPISHKISDAEQGRDMGEHQGREHVRGHVRTTDKDARECNTRTACRSVSGGCHSVVPGGYQETSRVPNLARTRSRIQTRVGVFTKQNSQNPSVHSLSRNKPPPPHRNKHPQPATQELASAASPAPTPPLPHTSTLLGRMRALDYAIHVCCAHAYLVFAVESSDLLRARARA
jgi:hypothetical protein